jgi:RNA polymerase sigma factor (sigma-70 family)
LDLNEMEHDFELGEAEWDVLEKYRLSPRQKECMYLFYWNNNERVTQQNVADALGISRRSVRTHLKRARDRIRECRQKAKNIEG